MTFYYHVYASTDEIQNFFAFFEFFPLAGDFFAKWNANRARR